MNVVTKPPLLMRFYQFLLHAFPMIKGGLTPLSFNRVTNRQFARCHGSIVARMTNGIKISVAPNDYHGRILYLFGTNDPKVQVAAQQLLREGDVFLDIGANYSSIGLSVADKVGPTGGVHLFEPQDWICQSVDSAILEFGLKNVHLHRIALMDRDGQMELRRPRNHSGMATLIDYGGDRNNWDSVSVPVRDIASYVSPLIVNRSFGVKIDIEGAERYIMPWLLRQANLRFVIFEAAHEQNHLFDLIQESGLRLFGLCKFVFRSRIRAIHSIEEMRLYHDVVAIRLPGQLPDLRDTSADEVNKLLRMGDLKLDSSQRPVLPQAIER